MRGAVLYAPGDVRVEDRPDPRIVEPTDAIIRLSATCVCGSDLWPYRGVEASTGRRRWATSTSASSRKSAATSRPSGRASSWSARSGPPTTPARSARPATRAPASSASPWAPSAPRPSTLRVPLADGTLVATPDLPVRRPGPAACSPPPTCWAPAGSPPSPPRPARARPSRSSVTARSACWACSPPRQLGAERIIAMSRHDDRQQLALEFGATDIVAERGDEGVARIKDLTDGLGAHSVIEAVGTQESMLQAIRATRPGGHVGFVGVTHGVELPGDGAVLVPRPPARRPRARPPLPARADRPHLRPAASTPARSSTSHSRSRRPPRATGPWTSAAPSRRCCGRRRHLSQWCPAVDRK